MIFKQRRRNAIARGKPAALPPATLPGLPQQYRLVVVTAKPSAASAVGLAGPGDADVLPFMEANLRRTHAPRPRIQRAGAHDGEGTCQRASAHDGEGTWCLGHAGQKRPCANGWNSCQLRILLENTNIMGMLICDKKNW